jgi:hypothetical protein
MVMASALALESKAPDGDNDAEALFAAVAAKEIETARAPVPLGLVESAAHPARAAHASRPVEIENELIRIATSP